MQLPVVVHNWTTVPQSGTVTHHARPPTSRPTPLSKPYGPLAGGADTTVTFTITNTDTTLPGGVNGEQRSQTVSIAIATSYSAPAGSASETLSLVLVPTTVIPQAASAPTLDAAETPGEYTGPALDLSRPWSGSCNPVTKPCGNPTGAPAGDPASSYAKVTWTNDNLYLFIHVMDNYQSYAVTPAGVRRALAGRLGRDPDRPARQRQPAAASTRPRRSSSASSPSATTPPTSTATASTAPAGSATRTTTRASRPDRSRPTLIGGPNAVGVQVVSSVTWVGNNQTTPTPGPRGIPRRLLQPRGQDPDGRPPGRRGSDRHRAERPTAWSNHLGLNITPYDNDNTAARRHDPAAPHRQQHPPRLGRQRGSVQSDPYRWGHAFLAGYTPPPGRSTTTATPILQNTNLDGADSPESIYNAATNGVPLSGREPAPASDSISIVSVAMTPSAVTLKLNATGTGTAHVFLYAGDPHAIPVYNTSCTQAADPWPDWSFTPCNITDGTIPPWSPDMSGRVIRDVPVADHRWPAGRHHPARRGGLRQSDRDRQPRDHGRLRARLLQEHGPRPVGAQRGPGLRADHHQHHRHRRLRPHPVRPPGDLHRHRDAADPAAGTPTGSPVQHRRRARRRPGRRSTRPAHATLPAISSLAIGTHTVCGDYRGDSVSFVGSTSPSINHTVKKRLATTTAVTSGLPSIFSSPVTFTATVTPENAPVRPRPHRLRPVDGRRRGRWAARSPSTRSAQATLTTNALPAGHHGIRAQYIGDANYTGSTSPTFTQQVKKATPTGIGLRPPAAAHHPRPSPPSRPPSPTRHPPAVLDSGHRPVPHRRHQHGCPGGPRPGYHASFKPTWNLPTGTHTIKAKYLGNANFLAVYTPGLSFKINP